MLIGQFVDIEFEVAGIPHIIAILGPNNADLDELARDFTKIVEVCSEMFGGLPYERYAFVFTTLTGGGSPDQVPPLSNTEVLIDLDARIVSTVT